ncbi:hypothetical protein M8J77_003050 [Diaphorina citri]|nr:hypothetical protein M8J77_003050 [Diaphorina citri]
MYFDIDTPFTQEECPEELDLISPTLQQSSPHWQFTSPAMSPSCLSNNSEQSEPYAAESLSYAMLSPLYIQVSSPESVSEATHEIDTGTSSPTARSPIPPTPLTARSPTPPFTIKVEVDVHTEAELPTLEKTDPKNISSSTNHESNITTSNIKAKNISSSNDEIEIISTSNQDIDNISTSNLETTNVSTSNHENISLVKTEAEDSGNPPTKRRRKYKPRKHIPKTLNPRGRPRKVRASHTKSSHDPNEFTMHDFMETLYPHQLALNNFNPYNILEYRQLLETRVLQQCFCGDL